LQFYPNLLNQMVTLKIKLNYDSWMMLKCQWYVQVHMHHTNVFSTLEWCTSCLCLCLTKVYIYIYCTYTCMCWITFYDTILLICKVIHKFVTFSLCCKGCLHICCCHNTHLAKFNSFIFWKWPFHFFLSSEFDCFSSTLSNARELYD
jgi:hypothetical protein